MSKLNRSLLALGLAATTSIAAAEPPHIQNPEQLFDWAQTQFPALFPTPPQTGTFANYVFRFYPASGVALAVQNGQVYGFSDALTQRQMLPLTDIVCGAAPTLCTSTSQPQPPVTPSLTIYTDINFTGAAKTFTTALADPETIGDNFGHDNAESLKVVGRWQVCEHRDFEGVCAEVNSDISDLRALHGDTLFRSISSWRPLP